MNAQLMLAMRDVSKAFNGTDGRGLEVLRGLSFNVSGGETLGIVGPSGCGKTTILKIIAGLVAPTSGDVIVAGESPVDARMRRMVSFVFQRPVLLPWLTLRRNVQLPGELLNDEAIIQKTDSLLELVGLRGFENAYPRELSGGMQARAALARALSFQPKLLLMDEPFAALDALTRNVMQNEFLKILRASPATVVFVTHSIDEAVYLSDRVVVLSNRPAEILLDVPILLAKPRTRESKDDPTFLGYRAKIEEVVFGRNADDCASHGGALKGPLSLQPLVEP